MDKKFHLIIDEPSIVVQGEVGDIFWGHYQFPTIAYTKDGNIVVNWEYGNDTIEYNAVVHSAVSRDGGTTWSEINGDENISYPKMTNGKCFVGFMKKGAHTVDYLDKYTPVYTSEITGKRYFAKDIAECEDTAVFAIEEDSVTGEREIIECKVNWPYMPVNLTTSGMVYPVTMIFALSQKTCIFDNSGKMYLAVYCNGFNSDADSPNDALLEYMDKNCVYIFESSDCARTWNYLSQIATNQDVINFDANAEGFCEPKIAILPDGSFLMLIRTGSKNPMFVARSTDGCKTWSKPEIFDSNGVFPQILPLKNGITLATYGRPILKVRATADPSGKNWQEPIILPLTVSTNPNESQLGWGKRQQSCFYTGLLETSENTALLVHTDFHYPNPEGKQVKTVMVRKITVVLDD